MRPGHKAASARRPEFASEVPSFVAEIKAIFASSEIAVYLGNLKRVGAAGHVLTDEQYEFMRDAGVYDQNIVRGAEDAILVERIKEMLLRDGGK